VDGAVIPAFHVYTFNVASLTAWLHRWTAGMRYLDIERLPRILRRWDVLVAPRPDPVDDPMARISTCSSRTSINVLMLDERRVVVEAGQPTLHRALRDWGFEPMALPFIGYGPFGDAFHCATLDVRREGELRDWFS